MKRKICLFTASLMMLAGMPPALAQESPELETSPVPQTEETGETQFNESAFGVIAAFSHTFSSTTGIAMSPLLGMGVLGAWKYYKSDEMYRNSLPWYSKPWVWSICLGIFLLLKSKDTLGAWIPEMVKKPITVLDDVAEKASALIVALAVVPPAVWAEMEKLNLLPDDSATAPMAMAPILVPVLVTVAAVVSFVVVWFAFNALSSIKILSPSSFINSAISVCKGAVITVFAALAALNPWVGLILSLAIVITCAFIFGWAFRWNVFGTLFVKDFFTAAFNKPLTEGEELKGFSTRFFPGVKTRTYGRITREGDELVFRWKPWLFLPSKRSRISVAETDTAARKGLFLPSVTLRDRQMERDVSVFDFRLRYRSHAEEIQNKLQLNEVKPNFVLGGIRASWEWFKDQLKRGAAFSPVGQQ
ncbi:MAG: hypothetical protein P1V20_23705 [Verrucomicrobiales bacterium]|nr:hypothetical protein [Verrucomicrobiales bacterium]